MRDKNVSVLYLENTLTELSKFNYILAEGKKGNHLIFSSDLIKKAFQKDTTELNKIFREHIEEINQALNESFEHSTFQEKQAFIQTLPEEIQFAIVYGYFQLIEGQIHEEEKIMH